MAIETVQTPPDPTTTTTIGSLELLEAAGITIRQVQYWTAIGRLESIEPNPGSGTPRQYHPREIAVARALKAIMAAEDHADTVAEAVRHGFVGEVDLGGGLYLDLSKAAGAELESVA